MEDQKTLLGVHLPNTRVTLILNLVVRPQMPLAVSLTAPKRVIAACIRWLDAPQIVRTALSRNPSRLGLIVLARRSLCSRNIVVSIVHTSSMAVLHMIRGRGSRRARSGRVDVSLGRVAVARNRVVVRPLVRGVEVSKRIQRTIHVVVVVAAVSRDVGGVVAGVAIVVIGTAA